MDNCTLNGKADVSLGQQLALILFNRDMFVDEGLRPKLWRRGISDSILDDTDLVCS